MREQPKILYNRPDDNTLGADKRPVEPAAAEAANPADAAWQSVEAPVFEALDTLYQEKHDAHRIYEEDERGEMIDRLRTNEKVFFTKVVAAVEKARGQHQQVAVLFDVDETIAKNVYKINSTRKTVFRPSAIPLMELLSNKYRCRLGLFTNRSALEEQLKDPETLAPLAPYLDNKLLVSTRSYSSDDDSMGFANNLQNDFGGEDGIVDNALIAENPFDRPSSSGDMNKLNCLREIRGTLPKGAVVIVDDMHYPSILNEKAGLYGVSLYWMESGSGVFNL